VRKQVGYVAEIVGFKVEATGIPGSWISLKRKLVGSKQRVRR
jgi:hypothetical protein